MTSFPESDLSGTISRLFVYPVKSCAGVEVQEALLTETGLDLDRAWMVVDAQGMFLTQRSLPRMALIRPEITDEYLLLHFPGMDSLQIPLLVQGSKCRARVWKDTVDAWDLGEWAAPARSWLSRALAQDCRAHAAAVFAAERRG